MRRLMDTMIRGYFYCRQGIRMLGTLPSIIFKGGTTGKDFMFRQTPDNKMYFQKSNDNSPLANYLYLDWDNETINILLKMLIDRLEVSAISPNLQFTTTESTRVGKNFTYKHLTHSGDTSKSGLLLQKLNGSTFVGSINLVDWDTGEVTNYTKHSFPVIDLSNLTEPPPKEGCLYYNKTLKKWRKCSDGVSWVDSNI